MIVIISIVLSINYNDIYCNHINIILQIYNLTFTYLYLFIITIFIKHRFNIKSHQCVSILSIPSATFSYDISLSYLLLWYSNIVCHCFGIIYM